MTFLAKIGKLKPIIHEGDIITFQFKYNNCVLYFRDSYLLLPSSLRKLGKSLNILHQKGIFPHKFLNINNLDFVGNIPSYNYFYDLILESNEYKPNITLDEYNEYTSKFNNLWNLRDEAIKYCELDCISLYEILIKFNDMIYDLYHLNINQFSTLPSLGFSLFRSQFMNEETIPQLQGGLFKEIQQSYFCGAVDMYIPYGENLFAYDVNSLYPYVMKTYPMPLGQPQYFEGDISFPENKLAFVLVDVKTPTVLKEPIICMHHKTKGGIRTLAPLGSWKQWLFSPEMDNAKNVGYTFKIHKGYLFDKGFIFNDFIDKLYKLRLQYPKSHPMNYIAKILMNSLYGRFGMKDISTLLSIINKKEFINFALQHDIFDVYELESDMMVQYLNEEDKPLNINVAIASAVTAYARIHMYQF